MLQQIENFKGIFICATNLYRDIDPASLRRFTFKLEFKALTEQQRWEMFINETKVLETVTDKDELEHIQKKLWKIKNLTPGDFATVKRQAIILDQVLTPEEWIVQLNQEAEDKLEGIERNGIGFKANLD